MLALVREGLTNEQIAERLNVSLATAKFHVSEIMGKLGVASRSEAAAWPGRPAEGRRALVLPWLTMVLSRVQRASVARTAGALAIVVALLALVVLAIGVVLMTARSTSEEARPPGTPEAPEAVTQTDVIVFRPSTTPSKRESGGRCGTSIVLTREGAWRCTSPRAPSVDPCFGEAGATEVTCPLRPEPGYVNAYVLELDEPLVEDAPPPTLEARRPNQAWVVETSDGVICGFKAGGTAPGVNGERMNYFCDDGSALVGLPTAGRVWTAKQVEFPQQYSAVPAGTVVPARVVELRTVWR